MADDFNFRIGVDGETEFKNALGDMVQALKRLNSEAKLVTADIDTENSSMQNNAKRREELIKQIAQQRAHVEKLRAAMDDEGFTVEENTRQSDKWKTQLNEAVLKLSSLEGELKGIEKPLDSVGDGMEEGAKGANEFGGEAEDAAKGTKEFGKEAEDAGKKTSIFGDVLKATLAADAIKAGISFLVDGIKEIGSAISSTIKEFIISGGFDRAMNIEQAQFKLKGLGHDTESVDQIMKNALASVKGTAYGLDSAVASAAGLVAAGVEIGSDLERSLKLTADAAAISGRSMDEMGLIFNKVAAANRVTARETNSLLGAGIPILELLGQVTGKTAAEVKTMVSDGKIGMAEFLDAIEKGMGGAALAIGETFQGSVANLKTAGARMGAGFITPFTQALTPAIGILTSIIDDIASGATDDIRSKAKEMGSFLQTAVKGLILDVAPMIKTAMEVLPEVLSAIIPEIQEIIPLLSSTIAVLLGQLLQMLGDLLQDLLPVAVDALMMLVETLIDNLPMLTQAAVQLVASLVDGIAGALPKLIPAAVKAVVYIVKALIDNLPLLIEAALALVQGLADGVIEALPVLIAALPELIDSIVNCIMEAVPMIIDAGMQLLSSLLIDLPTIIVNIAQQLPKLIHGIVESLLQLLPFLIDAGVQLFVSLVRALPEIISTVVAAIPVIIDEVLAAIVGLQPLIVECGMDLLVSLVKALPQIIATIIAVMPSIIASVVAALIDSIPLLIQCGVDLLISLVQDLPTIIECIVMALPEIIAAIVQALLDNIPMLIESGIKLLTSLITALPKIITEVIKAAPQIVTAIVDAFKGLIPRIVESGRNLLEGLWQGIQNAKDWLFDRVRQLGADLVQAIKNMFGISSPSKLFRDEIGVNLALGLGEGFTNAMKDVTDDMAKAIPTAFDMDAEINATANRSAMEDYDTASAGQSIVVHIHEFHNHTSEDKRVLAREISILIGDGIRRRGAATA